MSDPHALSAIFWSQDAATQRAILWLVGFGAVAFATIHVPLLVRMARLRWIERKLCPLADEGGTSSEALLVDFDAVVSGTPLHDAFREFERRWRSAQIAGHEDRAPIRLVDVLDDRPLLAPGPRRSLLPALPGLFLSIGVLAALMGLIPGLAQLAGAGPAIEGGGGWFASQLGLSLRTAAWGFLLAIFTSFWGRIVAGGFEARTQGLDTVVERAFGSVSPGELAELSRQHQQKSLETLGRELTQFGDGLNERMERGLQRIETSTSRAASLVSQEQRGALHGLVQELSLSVRQGVEHHLAELRGALQRAVDHQGSVTNGLAETFQRMVENANTQERVAQTLVESAGAVQEAAQTMRSTTGEMKPVLEHLSHTGSALEKTAERIQDTQQVVSRTADGVRTALEHAASGVQDQRDFLDLTLGEIRRTASGLGDGLGESLQRSLREVDDVLSKTVGQLRETLAESNETIERLSSPIRAAEGATRETHVALDRVKGEVEALGQWLSQTARPLRSGLADVESRAGEVARALTEFNERTRQIDKTMEALRVEIHEESRRLQGTGSDLGRRFELAREAVGVLESTGGGSIRAAAELPAKPLSGKARPAASEGETGAGDAASKPGRGAASRSARPPEAAAGADTPGGDAFVQKSGYRLGAARAKGPDPYERFNRAGKGEPRPETAPVKGAEGAKSSKGAKPADASKSGDGKSLGQDLKLSGLLGRRDAAGGDAGASEPAAGDEHPKAAKPPKRKKD